MADKDKELSVKRFKGLSQVTFKRPKSLNALSLEMIRVLDNHLDTALLDRDTKVVLVQGSGGKSFCAGGDVISVYNHGLRWQTGACPFEIPLLFFREEYRLNNKLYDFSKPYIAYLNGIVMGGGFGVSAPGELLVTCEDTLFAMPEVHIGLFPDVGSMYYLHKLKGNLGLFVALTGARLSAQGLHALGLAKYHILKSELKNFKEALANATDTHGFHVEEVLDKFHSPPEKKSYLEGQLDRIHEIFSLNSVSAILEALSQEGSEWALEAHKLILGASPTSLEVTFRHWQKTKGKTFKEVVEQDFRLVQWVIKGHDFYMGVNEQLIRKTKTPLWQPNSLEDVQVVDINSYFETGTEGLF